MDTQYYSSSNYSKLFNPRFFRNGNNLIIEADIHIDGDMISHDQRLEVIPVLYWENDHLELPLVLVNGRKRHRAYKQMCEGMGQQAIEKAYRIYKEMTAGRNMYCRYRQEIPYDSWMENAVLQVREE